MLKYDYVLESSQSVAGFLNWGLDFKISVSREIDQKMYIERSHDVCQQRIMVTTQQLKCLLVSLFAFFKCKIDAVFFTSNPWYDDAHVTLCKDRRLGLIRFGQQASWDMNHFSLDISTERFWFSPKAIMFCAVESSVLLSSTSGSSHKARKSQIQTEGGSWHRIQICRSFCQSKLGILEVYMGQNGKLEKNCEKENCYI